MNKLRRVPFSTRAEKRLETSSNKLKSLKHEFQLKKALAKHAIETNVASVPLHKLSERMQTRMNHDQNESEEKYTKAFEESLSLLRREYVFAEA